ncbi:MAG: 16S rRNA (guanine(966)-N(2))-methyltransferase RsmD [Bacilli bacterium]|nr:16S rRNA (guanine(966)-N(2))-methyltransferase RsmD [Bacilli bacterium]
MRVISGKYKGKIINGFNIDGTRPTMDRIKESLFGMIQIYLEDSTCLDLFAGSGSLGIEALSNDSKQCYFVEKNDIIFNILKENLKMMENAILIKQDYEKFLSNINTKFDIVFLDPPYKLNLISKSIEILIKKELLNDNAIIICEYETEKIICDLAILKEKKYGSKFITIYKYEKN